MGNFKIDEKVVCINDECGWIDKYKYLVKGEIYEIKSSRHAGNGRLEFQINGDCGFWDASRFRKLDYAHTEKICAEIIESLKIEEVQLN